jgi:hypothetical protein
MRQSLSLAPKVLVLLKVLRSSYFRQRDFLSPNGNFRLGLGKMRVTE